jgi:hypothetical protein
MSAIIKGGTKKKFGQNKVERIHGSGVKAFFLCGDSVLFFAFLS